ncbi:hypothetical protein QQ045_023253 [Rhodiola kirilowii]
MASRILSRRLLPLLRRSTAATSPSSASSSFVLLQRNYFSAKADSLEPNLDPPSKPEQLSPMLAVFEDMIHGMIVQRCEPEWLPFVPGSSFWVPPRPKSGSFIKEIEKFSVVNCALSDEETMALTTMRGWPSSEFFVHGKEVDIEKLYTVDMQDKEAIDTNAVSSENTND